MTNQTFSVSGGTAGRENIAQRAYEIWERAGRPDGQSASHWLQAEAELTARTSIASPQPAPAEARGRSPRRADTPTSRRNLPAARN